MPADVPENEFAGFPMLDRNANTDYDKKYVIRCVQKKGQNNHKKKRGRGVLTLRGVRWR